ncbi:MAG: hypothetical protein GF313_10470 [Caldithrix sp.]|nr:hypothetical protein [Caldithrix sp.]
MNTLKRWLPFIILIVAVLISGTYFFLRTGDSDYTPQTDDVRMIYREACAQCHAIDGSGSGLLYPAFNSHNLSIDQIKQAIQQGDFMMPAYRKIKGDTLQELARHVLFLSKRLKSKSEE